MTVRLRPARRVVPFAALAALVLAGLTGTPVRATAATAMTITSIQPDQWGTPTVAAVHIAGTGLDPSDTVTDTSDPSVVFSSVTSDGDGGLDAIVSVSRPYVSGTETIAVTSPGSSAGAACDSCIYPDADESLVPALRDYRPGATSLRVAWTGSSRYPAYAVAWTPQGGSPEVAAVTATHGPTLTRITGLTAGTPYSVTIAGLRSDGQGDVAGPARVLTEEVGTAPAAPRLEPVRGFCCKAVAAAVASDAPTWASRSELSYLYTFTGAHGTTRRTVTAGDGKRFEAVLRTADRHGVTVTAVARNGFAASAPSRPIRLRPVVTASGVRRLRVHVLDRSLRATWRAPSRDGGAHVTGYRVVLRGDGQTVSRVVHRARFSGLVARRHSYRLDIRPLNRAGRGAGEHVHFTSD